jgi:hypothetical protein
VKLRTITAGEDLAFPTDSLRSTLYDWVGENVSQHGYVYQQVYAVVVYPNGAAHFRLDVGGVVDDTGTWLAVPEPTPLPDVPWTIVDTGKSSGFPLGVVSPDRTCPTHQLVRDECGRCSGCIAQAARQWAARS